MNSKIKKTYKTSLAVGLIAGMNLLAGCESDSEKTLYAAQSCLDNVRQSSEVQACYNKVSGMTGAQADLVRCNAAFLAQGFTGSRLASAFQQLKSNTNGQDPFINIMGYLVFSSGDSTFTEDNAVTWCTNSGVASLKGLAAAAKMATFAARISAGIPSGALTNFDPDSVDTTTLINNMKNAIDDLDTGTAQEQENFGTTALLMNESYCGENGSFKDNEVCTYMSQAIAGTDGTAAQVGPALIDLLKNK